MCTAKQLLPCYWVHAAVIRASNILARIAQRAVTSCRHACSTVTALSVQTAVRVTRAGRTFVKIFDAGPGTIALVAQAGKISFLAARSTKSCVRSAACAFRSASLDGTFCLSSALGSCLGHVFRALPFQTCRMRAFRIRHISTGGAVSFIGSAAAFASLYTNRAGCTFILIVAGLTNVWVGVIWTGIRTIADYNSIALAPGPCADMVVTTLVI